MRVRDLVTFCALISAAGMPAVVHASDQGSRSDYIIVFSDGADLKSELLNIGQLGGRITTRFESVFQGVAVSLPEVAIDGIRKRPGVEILERDGVVSTQETQSGATWGIDRVDQRTLPLDLKYSFSVTGAVAAYVIDTGIRSDHAEFVGRVGKGYSAINDRRGTEDCNGHGTHVAGTIGGSTYGVAKKALLTPVRVLDCRGSGTWSGVVSGIDWVVKNHVDGVPAVANMSLGGGASATLDKAVDGLIDDGVTVVVAAGNSNVDACTTSPARVSRAVTVGATTNLDSRASFSNFGSCLDIFAPGVAITSAWSSSKTSTNTISGTSMASPHVAGVVALILAEGSSDAVSSLMSRGTMGIVTNAGDGSPNRLLYSLAN